MADPDDVPAVWPGFPHVLTDTQLCPACFHRLTATTCSNCGLVLEDPRALQLLGLGRQILSLELERQELIGVIRVAHQPVAEAVPEAPPLVSPILVDVAPDYLSFPPPELDIAPEPVLSPAPPAAEPAPVKVRRRLTVPVLLLIVGVSLVGVAAIFFLVLAWGNANIAIKALIIGGVTLATMVAASLLRWRKLTATAEGIAVLGVILLGLDAWAVRANDLFGASGMDPVVYAGLSALVVGILCRVWSVISRLRGPDIAAILAIPISIGLLAAGLIPLETNGVIAAGFLGTAVGGLAYALPAPWSAARSGRDSVPERTALAVIGVTAVAGSAVMLVVGIESMAAEFVAIGATVALGAAHAVLLRPRERVEPVAWARPLGAAAAAIAAATAASVGWQLAAYTDLPVYTELAGPVIAVAVAVGLDLTKARSLTLVSARIAAAAVGAVSIGILLTICGLRGSVYAATVWTLWDTEVFSAPAGSDTAAGILGAIAALCLAVLLFLAPTLAQPRLRDLRPIAATIIVIVGALGTGIPVLVVGVAVAIAVIALIAMARGLGRAAWGVVAGVAALTAFLVGLTAPWLWAVGLVVAVVVPIAARIIVKPTGAAAVGLALTPVAVTALAAFIAPWAIRAVLEVEVDPQASLVLLQWVAVGALVAALALRLDALSRTALAASSYGLFAVSLLALLSEPTAGATVSAALGEPFLGIVRSGVLLVLLAVVALVRTRVDALPALGAAALLAPVAACVAVAVGAALNAYEGGPLALSVAGTAAVVVWLGALVPERAYGIAAERVAVAGADAAPAADSGPAAMPPPYRTLARRAADVGALATAAAAWGWDLPEDLRWAMLAIVALGFAGAAITRGWADVAGADPTGVPETRAEGVALAQAPRRLLAWPAFAAAALAWMFWLAESGSYQIELFVLPPAVGLTLFGVMLVWLRRQAEATIAVAVALVLGLVVPAVVAFTGAPEFAAGVTDSPVRGTVVILAAAVVTLLLAWTPARRVRMPALAGAVVALVALGIVAIGRALSVPAETPWLLLLVGIAYAAAFGFVRGRTRRGAAETVPPGPAPVAPEVVFAAAVPPIVLAAATVAVLGSLDDALVVSITLAITGVLHIAAATLHRLPLAAATRWTALGGAVLATGGGILQADFDAVELITMPLAAILAVGATFAMWRRHRASLSWPGGERFPWLIGLGLAVAPSVLADPNDPRTWLVITGALLAAIGCVVAPIADSKGLKAPSALLLSVGALAMGLRALYSPDVDSGQFAALAAGVGALLVAAAMAWMSETDAAPLLSTILAAAGAALLVAVVGVQSEGELAQTALTAVIAGTIGVAGAALLRWPRWAGLGAVLAIGGVLGTLLAVAQRFIQLEILRTTGAEPDLWALVGAGILAAVGIMALRSSLSPIVATVVQVAFALALVLFGAAELILLGETSGDELRTVLTMSALTAAGVCGWFWRSRLGAGFAPTAAALAVIFGVAALIVFAVRPVELVTVPLALGMILIGARALRRNPALRTWPALGPGLALLTIPSLMYDFTGTTLWRVVALGVVGVAMVVVGAVLRLQAPLILGSVVVLVHAVNQLWPWISIAYEAVPWWLWLGVGGAVLIFLAARYERRVRQLRTAFVAVTSLR